MFTKCLGLSSMIWKLPSQVISLTLAPGPGAVQTAKIMMALEEVCIKQKPDLIILVRGCQFHADLQYCCKKALNQSGTSESGVAQL